jgi:hypothetical protein
MIKKVIKDPRGRPRNLACEELAAKINTLMDVGALPFYITCDEKLEKQLRNSTAYRELNRTTGNSIRLFRHDKQLLVSLKGDK